MRQEIYEDPFSIHDWDTDHASRCFIHLVNSATWQAITGQRPPSQPPTARDYTQAGYPWFDYYDAELKALDGSKTLAALKSVNEKAQEKRATPLPDNETVSVTNNVNLRAGLKTNQVREADFTGPETTTNPATREKDYASRNRQHPRPAGHCILRRTAVARAR
jgi:hypothetical protein